MAQSNLVRRWSSLAPYFLSALRIAAAFMFTLAGSSKLFAFPAGKAAAFPTQIWFGGVLEFVGGIALLLGICTRPVAFVLSGEMAVAYFQFHFPKSVWPTVNGGVAAALYCFVFLYLSAAGGGPLSLDARRRR
jgi:putative oxidoreductase